MALCAGTGKWGTVAPGVPRTGLGHHHPRPHPGVTKWAPARLGMPVTNRPAGLRLSGAQGERQSPPEMQITRVTHSPGDTPPPRTRGQGAGRHVTDPQKLHLHGAGVSFRSPSLGFPSIVRSSSFPPSPLLPAPEVPRLWGRGWGGVRGVAGPPQTPAHTGASTRGRERAPATTWGGAPRSPGTAAVGEGRGSGHSGRDGHRARIRISSRRPASQRRAASVTQFPHP